MTAEPRGGRWVLCVQGPHLPSGLHPTSLQVVLVARLHADSPPLTPGPPTSKTQREAGTHHILPFSPGGHPGLEAGRGSAGVSLLFWGPGPPKSSPASSCSRSHVTLPSAHLGAHLYPSSQSLWDQMRMLAQAAYPALWPPSQLSRRARFSAHSRLTHGPGVQGPLSAPSGSSLSDPVVPRLLICPPEPPPTPQQQVAVWLNPNVNVRTPCHVPIRRLGPPQA